jgi:hypothetical protein
MDDLSHHDVGELRPLSTCGFRAVDIGFNAPRVERTHRDVRLDAETVDPDQARPSSAARLSLAMLPGQSAALASEEGTSMQLTCGAAKCTGRFWSINQNRCSKESRGRITSDNSPTSW